MTILGIDTAIPAASVALLEDGELIAEEIVSEHRPKATEGQPVGNHAGIILPLIQTLFDKTNTTIQKLAGIAVSIGPGSFTGLRIGLATAKGIAYESGIPLVGISTLHAHAARVEHSDGLVGAVLDARKGEVYVALFRGQQMGVTRLTPDALLSVTCAIDLLRDFYRVDRPLLLTGTGAQVYDRQFREVFGASLRICTGGGYPTTASQVARLAKQRLMAGSIDEIDGLAPVYLRISEAEIQRRVLV
jgi:tRNA threonylcarbamoyladenosine biosynthesis protein TsaB